MGTTDNSAESMYLKFALCSAANAARYIEAVIVEAGAKGTAKHKLQLMANKAKSIITDVNMLISPEMAKHINEEIADNWDTLAHENIRMMAVTMDNAKLLMLEKYTDDLLNDKYRKPTFTDLNELTLLMNKTIGATSADERLSALGDAGFDIVRVNS